MGHMGGVLLYIQMPLTLDINRAICVLVVCITGGMKCSTHSGNNILAGQSNQHRCLVSCWSSQYVHSAETTQTAMVVSCPP